MHLVCLGGFKSQKPQDTQPINIHLKIIPEEHVQHFATLRFS